MSEIICLKSLSKNYGDYRALREISFSVEEGEIFGFIGPNGAGKSTTIRVLMGLLRANGGSAQIFGKNCWTDAAKISKDVGYLPSEDSYYKNFTAREMLEYTANLYRVDEACAKDRILKFSDALNLNLSKKIKELSLGNKKKVGIICALVHSPKLIIMDEPTSGLDPIIQKTFYEILRDENKRGATIFFSSHVLSEVQKLCNRIAILKEGSLIDIQSMKQLKENGYKKVCILSEDENYESILKFDGIANFTKDKNQISFIYRGDISKIIKVISEMNIRDISIEEPSLEEIFLHYYE